LLFKERKKRKNKLTIKTVFITVIVI